MLGAQPLVVQKGIGHFISLIYRIRKNIYYYTGSLGAVCIMMCHLFSRKINDTLKLFKKVPLVRGALYASVLNCSVLIYFASKDALNRMYQGKMDQGAASISREYAGLHIFTASRDWSIYIKK